MTAKKIATLILTLFLVSTVAFMINKIIDDNEISDTLSSTELPDNVDVLYYFYTDYRCETCELIEKNTGETVNEYFSEEIKNGSLIWKALNTDEKENEHFLEDYELYSKAVVLVKIRDGEEIKFKNLEMIWELAYEESEFKKYISDEVKDFIKDN
ncbi:nitrophenyl compound nitroreductase subunit ArsF family protein [candidate division KSB1 bacterium]